MLDAVVTVDGRAAVRFERRLRHPVEAVWRAVTEPGELGHWFPAEVTADLRPGGAMSFRFRDDDAPPTEGRVTEYDPPRRFAFTWGGAVLRFELEPDDGGDACRLTFTAMPEEPEAAARDAAGWHVCLDVMERHLAGAPAEAPGGEPTDDWRRRYEEYAERRFPTGAPVPD